MQKQNKSNSKKRNTSLTLMQAELLAVTVQKHPCLYGNNSHRPHKEKNVIQNVWEAVVHELDFIADGKNSFFHFRCLYFTHFSPMFLFNTME